MGSANRAAMIWAAALTLAAGGVITYFMVTWFSNSDEPATVTSVARIEEYIQPFVSNKRFMGSVLVAQGNSILLNKGYGFANLKSNTPNTPSTKFNLASVTKQFTAASILLLEERGKLRVDDPVKKYLPSAPAVWDKITIFNLLTHTSGIPNYAKFPEMSWSTPTTPEKQIAGLIDKPLDFSPGQRWEYSNSNYVLLGYLIEKISGESYGTFLRQNIFVPLGMADSGYDPNGARGSVSALGYYSTRKGPVVAPHIEASEEFAAGGIYSTTQDLLLWGRGLFGGKVLSPASLKKMTTPFKNNYALGVYVERTYGRLEVWHGGLIDGFLTHLAYYPQAQLVVVVLSNVLDVKTDQIERNIASLAHGDGLMGLLGPQGPSDKSARPLAMPIETNPIPAGKNPPGGSFNDDVGSMPDYMYPTNRVLKDGPAEKSTLR